MCFIIFYFKKPSRVRVPLRLLGLISPLLHSKTPHSIVNRLFSVILETLLNPRQSDFLLITPLKLFLSGFPADSIWGNLVVSFTPILDKILAAFNTINHFFLLKH